LDKSCKKCIYLIEALGKHKPVLVCTNRDGARGQLYCSDLCSPCRSYRTIPVIDRPVVVQPKDSQIRFIPLTKGKVAIVDAADYQFLNFFKWSANLKAKKVYAYRNVNRKNIYMHRLITNPPAGKVVDHIDRNGLNNRRSNLRICSAADNSRNSRGWGKTSQYKGVSWSKGKKKWISVIKYNCKYHHIGCFDNQSAAAKAYDKMARKFFGQFAYLNFPTEPRT
jgi:hypothetical protein